MANQKPAGHAAALSAAKTAVTTTKATTKNMARAAGVKPHRLNKMMVYSRRAGADNIVRAGAHGVHWRFTA